MKKSLASIFGTGDSDSDDDAGPLFNKRRYKAIKAQKPKLAAAKPIRKLGASSFQQRTSNPSTTQPTSKPGLKRPRDMMSKAPPLVSGSLPGAQAPAISAPSLPYTLPQYIQESAAGMSATDSSGLHSSIANGLSLGKRAGTGEAGTGKPQSRYIGKLLAKAYARKAEYYRIREQRGEQVEEGVLVATSAQLKEEALKRRAEAAASGAGSGSGAEGGIVSGDAAVASGSAGARSAEGGAVQQSGPQGSGAALQSDSPEEHGADPGAAEVGDMNERWTSDREILAARRRFDARQAARARLGLRAAAPVPQAEISIELERLGCDATGELVKTSTVGSYDGSSADSGTGGAELAGARPPGSS